MDSNAVTEELKPKAYTRIYKLRYSMKLTKNKGASQEFSATMKRH
jgi:hypothetical protein